MARVSQKKYKPIDLGRKRDVSLKEAGAASETKK